MASNDTLYMTLELKDNLRKQIQEDTKDTEKLAAAIKELNVDLSKLTADRIQKNLTKNLNDAEKAMFKLMEAKEKVDKALGRNASMRSEGFLGMNESELLKVSGRLDEIVEKVLNIGAKANFSSNAVKDLLAELSAGITVKSANSLSSTMDKGLDKQVRDRAKAEKEAVRELATAFDDADKAAKNNVKNQELVKDALAKIATARANLSAASDSASMQDQAHARLLMSLLDQLAKKLNDLRGQFLGERGVLDGILGSGYKGLMRNVSVSINDIVRNSMNQGGMTDEMWEKHKSAAQAAEQHKQKLQDLTIAFDNLSRAEERERQAQAQANAQQEKAAARQNSFYQSQQKATQATRQRAEELVKLRMELLKTQAAELQGLMKNGKGVFSTQQYQEVQNALRGVREEMRQLEGVMQRLGSYSTRELLGFGRGTQNWSPLVTNGQQILSAQQAIRQLSLEEERLIQSIDKASSSLNNQNRVLGDLQNMVQNYIGLWGAKDFLNNIIEIGGQLEMQRLSIGAILGDTAHANDLFEKIKALAVQSPFGVVELDQYTKQLSAYGFKYNELYDMTKRLADISAGAGTDVGRLALALGHVRSEAALSGYTLRQFAMNNIPMVGELAKQLTEVEGRLVSVAEVRKRVKNKEISYEDVEAVIKKLTDEGGMFYNMQEVVSQSVKARWKNLKDSLDIMYGEMAEAKVGGALKETAVILTNLSRHWKELFAVIQTGLVVLTAYKAVMLVNTLLLGKEAAAVQAGTKAKAMADKANLSMASSYRLLTAAEQNFNGVTGETLILANALALSEKKLTAESLARQVALGRLTKAEAFRAIGLSNLTAIEAAHARTIVGNVYTYGRLYPVINGVSMAIKGLGTALKSLVWNPLTAILAVVGVATELWQKNNEEVERARQLNDDLFNRATEGIRNIKQMMGETGMSFTINGKDADFGNLDLLKKGKFTFTPAAELSTAEMVTAIDSWTQFIKEYSANKNNILNDAFSDESGNVRTLPEQYERLGKAVGETAESYVWLKEASAAAEYALDKTNEGYLYDDLVENISDYGSKVKKFNDAVSDSVSDNKQFWSSVLKAARTNKLFSDTLKENGVDAENLSEQIKILINNQETYSKAVKLAEEAAEKEGGSLPFYRTDARFDNSLEDYRRSMESAKETMTEDIEEYAVRTKQRLSEVGWDFKALTQGQMMAIGMVIAETVEKTKNGTEEVKKEVIRLMRQKMEIPIDADTQRAVERIIGLKKSLSDLVGHDWTIDVKAATNFGDVISNIRKSYKSAKEYFENAKPLAIKMGIDVSGGLRELGQMQRDNLIRQWKEANPGKDATMYEDFLSEWDKMAKFMNDAMGFSKETGISLEDPNKKKNGSKADAQLKKWKEQFDELKAFYSEYKKWAKEIGEDAALKKLYETGLWGQMFNPDGSSKYDMKHWDKAIDDFMKANGVKGGTTERDKFIFGAKKLKVDFDYDVNKERLDRELSELQEYLNRKTSQWNLYKSLLEKTGNKDFAEQAFADGRVWSDESRSLVERLNKMMGGNLDAGVWDMTEAAAKKYFEGVNGGYELWKKIVELVRGDYTEALNKSADAIDKLMTYEDKVLKIEQEIADLRNKTDENGKRMYGDNSPEMIAKERELAAARDEAFEHSADYVRFYESILSMTLDEAERIGHSIREHLDKSLQNGTKSAKQYQQAIKQIEEQLKKIRNQKGSLSSFLEGGFNKLFQNRYDKAESEFNDAVSQIERASKEYDKNRIKYDQAVKDGDTAGAEAAQNAMNAAQGMMKSADAMKNGAAASMQGAQGAMNTVAIIDKIIHGIDGMVQGIKGTFDEIREVYKSLGYDTESDSWNDWGTFLSSFSSASSSATKGWDSLKNGDIGGAIQGVVGSFTGWVTGIAKGWDAKMDRQIKIAQQQLDATNRLRTSIERSLERTLGGVYNYKSTQETIDKLIEARDRTEEVDDKTYNERARGTATGALEGSFAGASIGMIAGPIGAVAGAVIGGIVGGLLGSGSDKHTVNYYQEDTRQKLDEAIQSQTYYDEQLALLYKQRDELQHQWDAEYKSKESDWDKLNDWQAQIDEVKDKITYFARDMAKALYDIDITSWASGLTDAVVSAWAKGEDAVDAYKNKVKEMMKDLTTNILSKKIMEKALEKVGFDKLIEDMMTTNNGILDENSVVDIANSLMEASETSVNAITKILDNLKEQGWDLSDTDSSSGGSSTVSKAITEESSNRLIGLVETIRADVSVDRVTLQKILDQLSGTRSMSAIAEAQLSQLEQIAGNTKKNADLVERIYTVLSRVTQGADYVRVK